MSISLILFVIAVTVCVGAAIYGAVRTPNGFMGVMSFLSIPLWLASVIAALAIPMYPGWHPVEIAMLGLVLAMSALVIVTNKIDNERMIRRIKKK